MARSPVRLIELPLLYVETSIVSYLTSRRSSDDEVRGRQATTHRWWRRDRKNFRLVTSEVTINEASQGDPRQAKKRLALIDSMSLVDIPEVARTFVIELIDAGLFPKKAANDALHLAAAVFNGVDYLLTWNCKHLASGYVRPRIEDFCREHQLRPAIICTPQELMGDEAQEME
jgi:predicted nucleic acid-binding protein